MCSVWSGDVENAFFSSDKFDRCRCLLQAEYEYSNKSSKSTFYVLGIDVGRLNDLTEICVIKSVPQPQGADIKNIVNIYTLEKLDFESQAIIIKKLYYKYKARICSIDANGLGIGLVDFLTKSQIDPETGEPLLPFGVMGGMPEGVEEDYKKIRGEGIENDALYLIKANAPINTEAYTYAQSQLSGGKIKFLIDEQAAKSNYLNTTKGLKSTMHERNDYLLPYQYTSILKVQMLNLVEENEGVNILLKRSSKKIKKDKFSAFLYGLYYIKKEEEKARKRKKRDISQMMFFS